jgi:nicotinamidase-related amidase
LQLTIVNMSTTTPSAPALILVDIQQGFADVGYWGGGRNNPEAELRASELLSIWRKNRLPVFHVQHCSTNRASPLHETNPGNHFNGLVRPQPGEPILKKKVNSAFIGTDLQTQLDLARITTLVIAGLTTDHCISTTVRMAGNLGYQTFLVADATATFDKTGVGGQKYPAELIHQTALASLNKEFATIIDIDFIKQSMQLEQTNRSALSGWKSKHGFMHNIH